MTLVISKCVTAVKVSNFSGHYLHNRSTLDIGVLGYSVYCNIKNTLPWLAASYIIASPEHILPITAPLQKNFQALLSLLPYLTLYSHWLFARGLLFTCLKDKYPMRRVGQGDPRACPSISSKVWLKHTGFPSVRQSEVPRMLQEIRDKLQTGCELIIKQSFLKS
jgi:hypothetical protein